VGLDVVVTEVYHHVQTYFIDQMGHSLGNFACSEVHLLNPIITQFSKPLSWLDACSVLFREPGLEETQYVPIHHGVAAASAWDPASDPGLKR
jgi:hypothetical protein